MKPPPERILILGGGYTGIDAYRSIMRRAGRQVRRGELQITVVNNTPYHTFHGFTGEVLGNILPLQHTLTPLNTILPQAQIIEATVRSVNLETQTAQIAYSTGVPEELSYDHLLLATGSRDPFERLPGLREHAWRLKHTQDMQAFHAHLKTHFAQAQHTVFAVVGGGFAGVEMAAALQERLKRVNVPGEVHLFCAGDVLDVLRSEFPRLAEHAERSLVRAGVQLHTGQRVREVLPEGLRLESGQLFRADEVLYTAGIALSVLPGTEGLPRDEQHRLITDEYLHVQGHDNIWAGGDIAQVRHPVTGGLCPVNALWAMKHGMWAGSNIALSSLGRPLKRFSYRGLGQAASLGLGNGITELMGLSFTGVLGWILRLLFFVWYMPSKRMGLRVLGDFLRLVGHKPPAPPHLRSPYMERV